MVRDVLLQAQTRGAVRVVPRVGVFLQANPTQARIAVSETITGVEPALQLAVGREPVNVLHVLDARRVIEVELIGRAAIRRQMDDLLPARRLLDAMLSAPADIERQAYVEIDFRFHAELARLSGNAVLAAMQRTLTDLLARHFAELPTSPERRADSERFHIAIYSAIVAGDAERARREMDQHLGNVYQYLLGFVQQPPEMPSAG